MTKNENKNLCTVSLLFVAWCRDVRQVDKYVAKY